MPQQSVKEFPSDCFTVSGKRLLFCIACQQEVTIKHSIITSHVGLSKHTSGKKRLDSKETWKRHSQFPGGVWYRNLYQRWNIARCSSDLSCESANDIPMNNTLGRGMAVVLHFVDGEWNIQQWLVQLMLLAKSLKGEEVAHVTWCSLYYSWGKTRESLSCCKRDRATVNGAAMRTVKSPIPKCFGHRLFSHTIDNAGNCSWWLHLQLDSLFSHNPKERLLWKTCTQEQL